MPSTESFRRSAPSTAAQLLSELYPPLQTYWPNLPRASAPQAAFLCLDQIEALYGGAAGGGKSDALLAGALQYVDHPSFAALILRRTFKQLSLPGAIMARSKEWLKPHREVHWSDDEKTWTFPTGATITFGYLDTADDIYRYQGPEFQYVAFDELTQFNEAQYTYLFSRLRRIDTLNVPLRVRAASNPGGVGHAWVKQRFPIAVDDRPELKGGRIFVPAKVKDNPGLNEAEYAKSLANLSEVLRAQLLAGDWGAFEGAAYPGFDADVHVVDAFEIPPSFERFENMDFGSTNPTAWYVNAVDYDGNVVTFDEFYEPGLPSETAPRIMERRAWWHPPGDTAVCLADPSVFGKSGTTNRWGKPASAADEFRDHGITLTAGNNDRVAGYLRLAELLKPDPARRFPDWHPSRGEYGSPRWFIFRGCTNLIDQLQSAPLETETEPHPGEAVSRRWEGPYGHGHASMRYGLMSRPSPSVEPSGPLEDPRAELLRRVLEERDKPSRAPAYQV